MTAPSTSGVPRRTIPFDYAFRFALTGRPDQAHKSTVRVSIEASFVAVAIGYGVVPRRDPIRFGPTTQEDFGAADLATLKRGGGVPFDQLKLQWISNSLRRRLREEEAASLSSGEPTPARQRAADFQEVVTRGFRINAGLADRFAALGPAANVDFATLGDLFEEIPPDGVAVQFLYQLVDEGTGRAFQSDPILSTAGLGIHDGDRPFRRFAVPITFDPLTSIRMDVVEKSDVPCELHVSLQGFRVLGGRGSPTDVQRRR